MTTLAQLLRMNILGPCSIMSGTTELDQPITSLSVLETPDYEKYILENSLILTTLYPIQNDTALFKKLMYTLKARSASGIAIKLHRYVDSIPDEILQLANKLQFPVLTLDSDVNFSCLFNRVLSEIQMHEYRQENIEELYPQIVKAIYQSPSAGTLVRCVQDIEDVDLLIYNPVNHKIHFTTRQLEELFPQYAGVVAICTYSGDRAIYVENVYYGNQYIYKMVLVTANKKCSYLNSYVSVFKLLLTFIHQNKKDALTGQNFFIRDFITKLTTQYNTNEEIVRTSAAIDLDVSFPMRLILCSTTLPYTVLGEFLCDARNWLSKQLDISPRSLCLSNLESDVLIFISGDTNRDMAAVLKLFLSEFSSYRGTNAQMKLAYSNLIDYTTDIPSVYNSLTDAVKTQRKGLFKLDVICENDVRLITMLKKLSYEGLRCFYTALINPIIMYDAKHGASLALTLYTYIDCKFSIKDCAEKLFIHTNSVHYRLTLLKDLGYDIKGDAGSYLDVYLALYIYLFLSNGPWSS